MDDYKFSEDLETTRNIVRKLEELLLLFSIDVRRKENNPDMPLNFADRDLVAKHLDLDFSLANLRRELSKACQEKVKFMRLLFQNWQEWRTQLEIMERDWENHGVLLLWCDS